MKTAAKNSTAMTTWFVRRLRVRAFANALTGDQDTALRLLLMAQGAEKG